MIPSDALEAAAKALHNRDCQWNDWHYIHPGRGSYLKLAQIALEAALPALLSHEREQTRLAHLDAMVNRETASRLEQAITGVLELAAPQRHMVSAAEIREWIARALEPTE